jgi:2-phospho-L-lactate guanylyltransferase
MLHINGSRVSDTLDCVRVIAVPIKSLSKAKSRLARVLSPMERGALTLAMLEDVLDAALAVPGWETWVISPDEVALEIATRRKARPLEEKKAPLSAAVRQVEDEAMEREADALAILLGDLPLVTAASLTSALHTLGPVVVAPSKSDGGTNLLLRRPPRVIGARFGRESYRKHVESARAKALPVSAVRHSQLTTDLDVPEDLVPFLDAHKEGRTRATLLDLDVASRFART